MTVRLRVTSQLPLDVGPWAHWTSGSISFSTASSMPSARSAASCMSMLFPLVPLVSLLPVPLSAAGVLVSAPDCAFSLPQADNVKPTARATATIWNLRLIAVPPS